MKMTTTTRDLLVLAFAWGLAACGGLAAADMGTSESSTGMPSGSVEAVCTNRGAQCDWEITKCKGEPTCAKWYGCVSSCDADSPLTCFDKCSATPPTNGTTILTCLQNACVRGGKEVGVGGSDFDGEGGGGAAPNGLADGGPDLGAAEAGASTPGLTWDGCKPCIYEGQASGPNGTVVKDCQSQCFDTCPAKVEECKKQCGADEVCLSKCDVFCTGCGTAGIYKHVLGITPESEPNGCRFLTDWTSFEQCMFNSKTAVGVDAWENYVSSGLHQCVMTQCANVCLPQNTYQPCSSCLQTRCTDQANAYWQSSAAQDYGWCMDYCKPTVDNSCDCNAYIADNAGADILSQFVMCREQSCFDECSSY